jgi:hypothetical protein
MYWRISIVSLILLGAVPPANAVEIATYGTGLMSCSTYVNAREGESADEVTFIDWLVGYLSGVNATSNRRNNVLGISGIRETMYKLDHFCRTRPLVQFGEAVGMLVMGASAAPGAHSVEVTNYGSGFKSCETYIEAREPQSLDNAEFLDWLGGYLSGVNAISLRTNNILGGSELTQAIYWLDNYCNAHPKEPFAMAVGALVTADHRNR